jgi:uncharacterized membrane protein
MFGECSPRLRRMNETEFMTITPRGRFILFTGFPMAVWAMLFALGQRDDRFFGIGGTVEPYVCYGLVVAILVAGKLLYEHLSKRVVVPLGIMGWLTMASVIFWYFWAGPGEVK